MKWNLFICLGIVACSPWIEEETSIQVPTWTEHCETNTIIDSVNQFYTPIKCNEIRPNCTLHVKVHSQSLVCRTSQLTWDLQGESLAIHSEINPMTQWLPWSNLLYEMAHGNADFSHWWEQPKNGLYYNDVFYRFLIESLSGFDFPDSIPSTTMPWSYQNFQDTLLQWIRNDQISREQFLAWNSRKMSLDQLNQILLAHSFSGSIHDYVGSCNGAAPFHTLPQIGNADSYSRARKESELQGIQIASLAQWNCLLGVWKDTFPTPRHSVLQWRGLKHLAGNRYWLSDTTSRGYRLLLTLDSFSAYQLEEVEPAITLASTKYLKIQEQ